MRQVNEIRERGVGELGMVHKLGMAHKLGLAELGAVHGLDEAQQLKDWVEAMDGDWVEAMDGDWGEAIEEAMDGDLVEAIEEAMEGASKSRRARPRDRSNLDALGTGLILVASDGRVRIVTERACEMLGLGDRDGSELAPLIDEVIAAVGSDGSGELEWAGRPLRVKLTSYQEEAETWRLLELRDHRSFENVQTGLLLAARVRNLMRLFVGMAHDLRAPLNAITLHLELLHRTLKQEPGAPTPVDETTPAERLGIVDSELQRLQRGLELLLGQAVPVDPEDRPFDLRRAVSDIGDLLKGPARLDGKIVEVETGDREAMVDMKRDHVAQALLNVAINGLEAMSHGGHLHLRVTNAEECVRVEISDTGPGVDAEIRSRLFEIYETGKTSGVGAGLYMARLLLESQGGSIELTSTSSAGTTFTIELPAAKR